MFSVDDLKKLTPGWWGAIAGAMAAGATLFPENRLLAGLGGGVAMFVVARKLTTPCCEECAAAASLGVRSPDSVSSTSSPGLPRVLGRTGGLDDEDEVAAPDVLGGGTPTSGCATCGSAPAPTAGLTSNLTAYETPTGMLTRFGVGGLLS